MSKLHISFMRRGLDRGDLGGQLDQPDAVLIAAKEVDVTSTSTPTSVPGTVPSGGTSAVFAEFEVQAPMWIAVAASGPDPTTEPRWLVVPGSRKTLRVTSGEVIAALLADTAYGAQSSSSGTVSVSNFPATQPVSGTLTAKMQDGSGTALSTTLFGSKNRLDVNLAAAATPGSAAPSYGEMVGGSDGTNFQTFKTDTTGRLSVFQSPSNIATNQVSVANTATLIAAARTNRTSITLINTGAADVYIGGSGVTTTTGQLLTGAKGAGLVIDGGAAIYGIVSSGTQTVTVLEAY